MKTQGKIGAAENALVIIFFLTALSLPLIGLTFRWHVMSELEEKRHLATRPQLPRTLEALDDFPRAFTAYFNDNFGFRPTLIHLQAVTRLNLLGQSNSPLVIVGKKGWLFLSIEYSARGGHQVPPLTPAELEDWRRLLEGRRDWLARRGIPFLVTVFPRKEVIYPEYLPDTFHPVEESRMDQLTKYLKQHSTLEILDLRPALLEAKARHPVYYKTDSHWNYYGGFAGYQTITNALTKFFPQMKPISEADCLQWDEERNGDLTSFMGLRGWLPERSAALSLRNPDAVEVPYASIKLLYQPVQGVVMENRDRTKPRLVMFDDSGGAGLVPFLPHHFSRSVIVWQFKFDPALVTSEQPDVVILEMGEVIFANGYQVDLSESEAMKAEDMGQGKVPFEYQTVPAKPAGQ